MCNSTRALDELQEIHATLSLLADLSSVPSGTELYFDPADLATVLKNVANRLQHSIQTQQHN
ncbi:hypothetical protein EXT46_05395 [Pseudoalteromonas sp. CO325X]|uniref:hypothetical protein n=1 Tax=Pseudoalteromonas sp. CO325X TaxID=1777262 RepID=UPI001022D4FC|nr:hypothetical protein [Pseudoalteromonas sp. CO325X]RZF83729.1 hypothetical protein EXT46_05395 [Pseudoalteromonas sp. CO325X]